MPKYYISSGDMKEIVIAKDPDTAATTAFVRYDKKNPDGAAFGLVTMISEAGFDSELDTDLYSCTMGLLEKAGLGDKYST